MQSPCVTDKNDHFSVSICKQSDLPVKSRTPRHEKSVGLFEQVNKVLWGVLN